MRIIPRYYKAQTKQYGIMTWATPGYRAFDFFFGTHLFVLGFRRKEQ